MSTTGFATSDYTGWELRGVPVIILLLMIFGGCTGSTAGGLKFARGMVALKQSIVELRRRIFPHLLPDVRLNGSRLAPPVVGQIMGFMVFFTALVLFSTLMLSFLAPMDLETAFSASISALSNVGPGLGKVSPSHSWAWMTPAAKCLLSFIMITGRLELFTVLVIFLPHFWRFGKSRR